MTQSLTLKGIQSTVNVYAKEDTRKWAIVVLHVKFQDVKTAMVKTIAIDVSKIDILSQPPTMILANVNKDIFLGRMVVTVSHVAKKSLGV